MDKEILSTPPTAEQLRNMLRMVDKFAEAALAGRMDPKTALKDIRSTCLVVLNGVTVAVMED